jgi:hypothetical protein
VVVARCEFRRVLSPLEGPLVWFGAEPVAVLVPGWWSFFSRRVPSVVEDA